MRTFRRYTLNDYVEQVLRPAVGKVRFPEVHIHGTWKPSIADFRKRPGEYYIQVMYRFHRQQGWQDIGQHATVDPDGFIWDGRPLTLAPASATGHNGTATEHPYMFEMIGDFDEGKEKLDGAQLTTATGLTQAVISIFGSVPHLHREFTNLKTCPGSGIQKEWFLSQMEPKLSNIEALTLIQGLQKVWGLTADKSDKEAIHTATNAIRKLAGLPTT
jgi:hypothetical protein